MTNRENDILEIKRIRREKDSESLFEKGYGFIRIYSRDDEILKMMCEILEEDWHYSHEDLASSFQTASNPITSDTMLNVALSDLHTEHEEFYPLQRKCTWALADIGTEEAKTYLFKIEAEANEMVSSFATKRLQNWEEEKDRKGQKFYDYKNYKFHIGLEKYSESLTKLPRKGQFIFGTAKTFSEIKGHFIDNKYIDVGYVIVYLATNNLIIDHDIENQKLGEVHFDFSKINWITPNFFRIMDKYFRTKEENFERVLAIWIKKHDFEELLQESCNTIFNPELYTNESEWRKELEIKEVSLLWDQDTDPFGNKLERKTILLGLKGKVLKKFEKTMIKYFIDITDFIKEQKALIDTDQVDKMLVPRERYIYIEDFKFKRKIGIIY